MNLIKKFHSVDRCIVCMLYPLGSTRAYISYLILKIKWNSRQIQKIIKLSMFESVYRLSVLVYFVKLYLHFE